MFNKKQIGIQFAVFFFACLILFSPISAQMGKMTPEKKTAIAWIDEIKPTYDEVVKYIWEHPELSLVEFKSSAKLQKYLSDNEFQIKKGIAGMETAFIASWGSGKPVIGFLGEYDALPSLSQELGVTVQKPVVYGAPGHGCGHNIYGASGATAAIATAKAMKKHGIAGTVKFYGCPGEETGMGKNFMAREGAWDDCDVVIRWHPGTENTVTYGSNLANSAAKVQFHGSSALGSGSTEMGMSALDALELFNIGMNYLKEHLPDKTRTQYIITSGGEAPNIAPTFSEAWYLLRAAHRPIVDHMYKWMQQIAEGAALMTKNRAEVKLLKAQWNVLPNKALSKVGDANVTLIGAPPFTAEDQEFGKQIADALEKLGVKGIKPPYYDPEISHPDLSGIYPNVPVSNSSADTGTVSWIVPIVSFGAANYVKKTICHNWTKVAQSAMPPALKAGLTVSKWMAATALDLLKNPQLVSEAKAEHQKYLAQTPYYNVMKGVPLPTFYDLYGREWESFPKPPTQDK